MRPATMVTGRLGRLLVAKETKNTVRHQLLNPVRICNLPRAQYGARTVDVEFDLISLLKDSLPY